MSGTDKMKNTAENLEGKAKQATGRATGNPDKEDKGRAKQAKSDLKGAGEKVKDAFKH